MTTPELKPCPFCGWKPAEIKHHHWTSIECRNGKCPLRTVSTDNTTRDTAIKAWNTRATEKEEK